jgi:dihydroorotate dehydrogenase
VKQGKAPLGTSLARAAFLRANQVWYAGLLRFLIFRSSAQTAHERIMRLLRWADRQRWLQPLLGGAHRLAFRVDPVTIGGIRLNSSLILAAGLVKGGGFDSEQAALDAVNNRQNIIPGWRSVPRLMGPVEFGSFTRWPRLGNSGTVVWRDVATRSTQNRVGLKNPGAVAAAEFLAARTGKLPAQFGINVAVSPGVHDPDQQTEEVLTSLAAFVERGVYPSWFTLNLSCPNTEDVPSSHQTTEQARQLCSAAVQYLHAIMQRTGCAIPLWVKVGPILSDDQYRALMRMFDETGVRAVVATNTLPMPAPDDTNTMAGMGGGRLHEKAVKAAVILVQEKVAQGYQVDVVGCGGVQDGTTYQNFICQGIQVVQYWTALVYRGPLAAALIADETRSVTQKAKA